MLSFVQVTPSTEYQNSPSAEVIAYVFENSRKNTSIQLLIPDIGFQTVSFFTKVVSLCYLIQFSGMIPGQTIKRSDPTYFNLQ